VHAPDDWPAMASLADVEAAAVGFERTAPPAAAAQAYAAALSGHPDSLPLALGLGNARHAGGDLHGAAQAFAYAARRHDSPAAWINLALTRRSLGDVDGARQAADGAVEAAARPANARWAEPARQARAALGTTP
jgi:predicted Zn-dependent protease